MATKRKPRTVDVTAKLTALVARELEQLDKLERRVRRGRAGGNGGLGIPRWWKRKEYDAAHEKAVRASEPYVDGHATHVRARRVHCGKKCQRCPHGVYFYQRWRGDDGKQHEKYLGKWYPRGHGFVARASDPLPSKARRARR